MFQIKYQFSNISCFFLLGLYPRHQADHLSGSVVLLSLLCVTPVFFPVLLFSFLLSFQPSRVESTNDPALSPGSPERCVVYANYHIINHIELFLRVQAKFGFISGFQGWWLARCCAARSPLPLPLLSSHRADTAK